MKDELISFNTAKLAKEKGFTTPVTSFSNEYYNELGEYKSVSYNTKIESYEFECPTQSLLQRWLREIHHIDITITIRFANQYGVVLHKDRHIVRDNNNEIKETILTVTYENHKRLYEEALEEGLKQALLLL